MVTRREKIKRSVCKVQEQIFNLYTNLVEHERASGKFCCFLLFFREWLWKNTTNWTRIKINTVTLMFCPPSWYKTNTWEIITLIFFVLDYNNILIVFKYIHLNSVKSKLSLPCFSPFPSAVKRLHVLSLLCFKEFIGLYFYILGK